MDAGGCRYMRGHFLQAAAKASRDSSSPRTRRMDVDPGNIPSLDVDLAGLVQFPDYGGAPKPSSEPKACFLQSKFQKRRKFEFARFSKLP